MALLVTRASKIIQPHARQVLSAQTKQLQAAILPCASQVAHLTSTGGEPAVRAHEPWPYQKWPYHYNTIWQFFDHTRKRFDDNTKMILIEGNIGVGKSWFAKQLAKEFDMRYIPDKKDEPVFITESGFDLRELNLDLPPRSGFCDIETFFKQEAHPDLLRAFGRTQLQMYYHHFMVYAGGLEHLLNTGQGVVMERGMFSHMVFHNVLRQTGHLSAEALKYLNFVYDNTVCEMWRPHLVIYLDAPISFVRTMINKRNVDWEANSPILTDEFLATVDKVYKNKYLPYMSKWSEVVTYDLTELTDWDIVVEELENIDLDTRPFDNEYKFKDWQGFHEDDWNLYRMNLASRNNLQSYFTMAVPWDAQELMYHPNDSEFVKKVILQNPEVKYAAGYNPEKHDVLLKW